MTGRSASEHLSGRSRSEVAADCASRYDAGATLRGIALSVGINVATVRKLLLESGVPLRPRAGTARRVAPAIPPTAPSRDGLVVAAHLPARAGTPSRDSR
ncbi:hypothetical protein GCM10023201_52020 [Actinomycetospora corticicola]|uniref:helix-turn-helix domain-containing protein n=1 Tax=Actinomycetospora corticicola TaxID=663602 RepID=UPI003382830C